MPETETVPDTPILTFDLSWAEENGERIIRGCASDPEEDKEKEIMLREALEEALPNFMYLPIIHLDHTERPIGLVKSAYFDTDDKFQIDGRVKPTSDCDDVWSRIKSGELSQYSIFGRRIEGSEACSLNPRFRDRPCITKRLHLDSISICPKGNAINPNTEVEVGEGVKKALDSGSSMVHTVPDGAEQEIKKMVDSDNSAGLGEPTGGDNSAILQKILEGVEALTERLDGLEQRVDDLTAPDNEGEPEGEVEKAEDDEDGGEEERFVDDGGSDDLHEAVSIIGEALQIVIQKLDEIQEVLPSPGGEDEDTGPEEEPGEVKKCGLVRKSIDPEVAKLRQDIALLQEENKKIRKSIRPRQPIHIVDGKAKDPEEIKKSETDSGDVNNVTAYAESMGAY